MWRRLGCLAVVASLLAVLQGSGEAPRAAVPAVGAIILDAAAAARTDPSWPAQSDRSKPTPLVAQPDASRPAEPERSAQANPKPRTSGRLIASYERPALPAAIPMPGFIAPRNEPLMLRLTWPGEVALAAFRRGSHMWLVFDAPALANIAKQIEKIAPELEPVEQWRDGDATVLRFPADNGLAPEITRDGADWLIDLRPRLAQPVTQVAVTVQAVDRRAEVFFPLEGGGRVVELRDPDLNDRLLVVPVTIPGLGVEEPRAFPQFRALGTAQGIVLVPVSDAVRAIPGEDGLRVTSNAGLLVSRESKETSPFREESGTGRGGRLFDLAGWRRGTEEDFADNRHMLQKAAAKPFEVGRLNIAHLVLARFYFAHGLGPESRSVLQSIAKIDKNMTRDPEVVLLGAATAFLVQDYPAAAKGLADPALSGEWEAEVWRAALAAAAQDWSYAAELFDRVEPLIDDYVRPVRIKLRLLAAEARLGIGDTGGASLYLDRVRQDGPSDFEQARHDYVEGLRLLLDLKVEPAAALWRQVAEGPHRPSQARARLALLELGIRQKAIAPSAAIEELERLRFLWRGDEFEVALLERLAELYVNERRYRDALHALRQAASHFPDSANAKIAIRRMSEIFLGIFLEDTVPHVPALTALALYDEFNELTPVSDVGDRVIERLVDRLVEVDLLERAAAILQDQMTRRLKDDHKVRAGARLALIQLLEGKPEEALEALGASAMKVSAGALWRQRRQLQARALADLGRGREALALLDGDSSEDALKLRAELLWDLSDWPAAALALARLLPEAPPSEGQLAPAESQAVLNLAIAQTLAGSRQALNDLAVRYGAAMGKTPQNGAFALLVSDFDRADITKVTEELEGIEQVQAFMAGYKARIADAGLSKVN